MALITCRECNEQVSDKASMCPHCGVIQKTKPAEIEDNSLSQGEDEGHFSWPKAFIGAIFGLIVGSGLSIRWGGGLFLPVLGIFLYGVGGGYLSNLYIVFMIAFIPVGLLIVFIASILVSF